MTAKKTTKKKAEKKKATTDYNDRVNLTRITPGRATELIEKSEALGYSNRSISDGRVNRYAAMFKDGSWDAYSSLIHVDDDGALVNGFHRCYAAVMSGESFNTIMAITPNRELTDLSVDQGRGRTAADTLKKRKYRNYQHLASAIRMAISHANRGYPYDHRVLVNNAIVAAYADENHKKLEMINDGLPGITFKVIAPSKLIFLQLIARNLQRAQSFGYELVHGYKLDGNGLAKGSPSFQLRERFMAARLAKRFNRTSDTLTREQETYILCNQYSKWLKGERVSRIQLPRIKSGDSTRGLMEAYTIKKKL